MVVTKNHPAEIVQFAYDHGFRLFGENRIQEASDKYGSLNLIDSELHMIGHLQSNKAKAACQLCHTIQSVDKLKTASEIQKHAKNLDKVQNIMIQLNTSRESSKSGILDLNDLWLLIDKVLEMPNIKLRGLMTIGPFNAPEAEIRRSFISLREILEKINMDLLVGSDDIIVVPESFF